MSWPQLRGWLLYFKTAFRHVWCLMTFLQYAKWILTRLMVNETFKKCYGLTWHWMSLLRQVSLNIIELKPVRTNVWLFQQNSFFCLGGYTAGPKPLIDLLRNRARPYLFSNTLPPPVVAAASKVFDILMDPNSDLIAQLSANTKRFRDRMTDAGFTLSVSRSAMLFIVMHFCWGVVRRVWVFFV